MGAARRDAGDSVLAVVAVWLTRRQKDGKFGGHWSLVAFWGPPCHWSAVTTRD